MDNTRTDMSTNTNEEILRGFADALREEEKSAATIGKYTRDAGAFLVWTDGRELTRSLVLAWKDSLTEGDFSPATVNTKIAAINRYLMFLGHEELKVRPLKIQRRVFRTEERELTRSDYKKLVKTAERLGQRQTALVMETICATGIRVSELRYITAESVKSGSANISMKGKVRTILIPAGIREKLLSYAAKHGIRSGEIFRGRNGKSLDRKLIWARMKRVCAAAGVAASKVFPHNLRHLFAVCYYAVCKDLAKLADVLGHSSIDTTRIYLLTSGAEHAKVLEHMSLIL